MAGLREYLIIIQTSRRKAQKKFVAFWQADNAEAGRFRTRAEMNLIIFTLYFSTLYANLLSSFVLIVVIVDAVDGLSLSTAKRFCRSTLHCRVYASTSFRSQKLQVAEIVLAQNTYKRVAGRPQRRAQ